MSVVGAPYAGRAFIVRVLGYSGVRNSELCDLRIGNVRLHDPGGARFHIPDAKTETGVRVVEMSPDLAEAFVDAPRPPAPRGQADRTRRLRRAEPSGRPHQPPAHRRDHPRGRRARERDSSAAGPPAAPADDPAHAPPDLHLDRAARQQLRREVGHEPGRPRRLEDDPRRLRPARAAHQARARRARSTRSSARRRSRCTAKAWIPRPSTTPRSTGTTISWRSAARPVPPRCGLVGWTMVSPGAEQPSNPRHSHIERPSRRRRIHQAHARGHRTGSSTGGGRPQTGSSSGRATRLKPRRRADHVAVLRRQSGATNPPVSLKEKGSKKGISDRTRLFALRPDRPAATKSSDFQGFFRWRDPDSNRGHHDFQSCALPTELSRRARTG